jgi:hypothetical protein
LELCLDCNVTKAPDSKKPDPESALDTFLGCPMSSKPFSKKNTAGPLWNHRFISEEDLAAGVTDWSHLPELVFGDKLPEFPDLVTPILKLYGNQSMTPAVAAALKQQHQLAKRQRANSKREHEPERVAAAAAGP